MRYIMIGLLTLVGTARFGMAQDINLLTGTIDGQQLCSMSLDDVTGVLGRPTSVTPVPDYAADMIGPTVVYHHMGLVFEFYPTPATAGEELVASLQIHLTRAWDADNSEWHQPFTGLVGFEASANWRVDTTAEELAPHEPSIDTPEEQRERIIELGLPPQPLESYTHNVLVGFDDYTLLFRHESVTRFLEEISLTCRLTDPRLVPYFLDLLERDGIDIDDFDPDDWF